MFHVSEEVGKVFGGEELIVLDQRVRLDRIRFQGVKVESENEFCQTELDSLFDLRCVNNPVWLLFEQFVVHFDDHDDHFDFDDDDCDLDDDERGDHDDELHDVIEARFDWN